MFIWRPKDVVVDALEDEDATTEAKEVKKITLQIYEADGGKAGRAKGKSMDNDDDDFAFLKKKAMAKANGAGPSCSKKEKTKRKSKSEDDDSSDDTEPSPEKGKAVVTPPSEGRQLRRRSKWFEVENYIQNLRSLQSRIQSLPSIPAALDRFGWKSLRQLSPRAHMCCWFER